MTGQRQAITNSAQPRLSGIVRAENWIAGLPGPVQEEIRARMIPRNLAAGDVLREAGGASDGLHQVDQGYLRLIADHADGRRTLVLIFRPGNCLSETAIVAHRPYYHHTVAALTDARVLTLPTEDFWQLYHRFPAIPEALCRKFADALSRSLILRELAATRRLRQKVASMFASLAETCGRPERDGSITIRPPLTQNDFADHLDVTRQAIQREISDLRQAGAITKREGLWRVLDDAVLGERSA